SNANGRHPLSPIDLRELQHEDIQRAAPVFRQRRRIGKLLALPELDLEIGHDFRDIELQDSRIGPHESPDINGGGKRAVVAFFESAQIVAADFRRFRDLWHGEVLRLARLPELFSNSGHAAYS